MQDFSNKIAVVTGGASGIGRSLVKELLALKYKERGSFSRAILTYPKPS